MAMQNREIEALKLC